MKESDRWWATGRPWRGLDWGVENPVKDSSTVRQSHRDTELLQTPQKKKSFSACLYMGSLWNRNLSGPPQSSDSDSIVSEPDHPSTTKPQDELQDKMLQTGRRGSELRR